MYYNKKMSKDKGGYVWQKPMQIKETENPKITKTQKHPKGNVQVKAMFMN